MRVKKYIKLYSGHITAILFILIFLTGCAGTNNCIVKGKEAAAAGNWEQSIKILQESLKKDPDNIEIKLMLAKTRWKASIVHMVKGEAFLKQKLYKDSLYLLKKSIEFDPANQKAESLIKKIYAMKKSDLYFIKGSDFFKKNKHVKAREAFEKALELNPKNMGAYNALAAYIQKEKNAPRFNLKLKSTALISLKFKKASIVDVFDVLSRLAGINFIFDKDFSDTRVTLFMTDVTFDRFLEVLLKTNNLTGKGIDEKTVIIYPDTPLKAKEYQEFQIKTFYLANLDAHKAVSLISRMLRIKKITANEKLNSVVMGGTREEIEKASKILKDNDRLPSEVLLNVEILEVSRTKEKQFGIEYLESITVGVGERTDKITSDTKIAQWISFNALQKLSNKELFVSSPTATLNLLKQDSDTRILANPKIRVKNSEKASILVGEKIPLRVNRRVDSSTGDVTSDYQYHDVGVKLSVEPVINLDGIVSLRIQLEISTLGPNVGTGDDPQYSIQTRSVKSVLTIADGASVVLGGLIKNVKNGSVRRVPLLGDIPVLKHLFSTYTTDNRDTDILMIITPIIIRSQNIIDQNSILSTKWPAIKPGPEKSLP